MNHIEEYNIKLPQIESFTGRIEDLIKKLLSDSNIKYHFTESRTKSLDSFKSKTKKNKYSNPLTNITDLTGIRIVTYYQEDIEIISSILKENFELDTKNSIDKNQTLNSNEFGYQSVHLVMSLNKSRNKLPEWKPYKDYKFEVQVRTVLQHAWASISHTLDYKRSYEVPKLLRRKLFRLAGLFELADEEFSELKVDYKNLEDAINSNSPINEINVSNELNLITIEKYFNENIDLTKKLINVGEKSGFEILEDEEDYDKDSSNILSISKYFLNIDSIEELNLLLEKIIIHSSIIYDKILRDTEDKEWVANSRFLALLLVVYLAENILIDDLKELGWDEEIAEETLEGIKLARKAMPNNGDN